MARINCRKCDICGVWLDERDPQFWLKIPKRAKLYYGVPELGMKRYDVCDNCMTEMIVEVQMRSISNQHKGDDD